MLKWLARAEVAIGMALLAAICCLVFAAGLLRSFGHPLIWSVDMAQLLFIWTSFIGADIALRSKVHIGMDLLVRPFPLRLRIAVELLLALAALAFLLTMTVEGYGLMMQNIERIYGDSGISYAWVTGAVPAGCLLLALTLAGHMIAVIRRWRGAPTLVFSDPDHGEIEDVL
ncbi:MAG: TRAP transporter small permease [Alphaproteobacteria bacterium]